MFLFSGITLAVRHSTLQRRIWKSIFIENVFHRKITRTIGLWDTQARSECSPKHLNILQHPTVTTCALYISVTNDDQLVKLLMRRKKALKHSISEGFRLYGPLEIKNLIHPLQPGLPFSSEFPVKIYF